MPYRLFHFALIIPILAMGASATLQADQLTIQPPQIELNGADREHALLATWIDDAGSHSDVTAKVVCESEQPAVAVVTHAGQSWQSQMAKPRFE